MEDAPTVVLVPSTPLAMTMPPASIQNSSSYPTQAKITSAGPHRPVSQTTIFSIYSMYEDSRASWSASSTATHERRSHERKSSSSEATGPSIKLRLSENPRTSVLRQSGHTSTSLVYRRSDDLPPTPDDDHPKPMSRRNSTHPPSAPMRASKSDGQIFSTESYRSSVTSQSSPSSRISSKYSTNHSPETSPRSSKHYHHEPLASPYDYDFRTLPPLPPSGPSSLYPTPAPTPPRQPSPGLQPPNTPNSLPLKHPILPPSASSKVSLVPSEGEDMDAFHVRNTYAQLEASGVKGDGYEEGIERTRARIGPSQANQLAAEGAIGDGNEKSKELDPREIQTLASVDRYGFFSVGSHDRLVLLDSAPLAKPLSPVQGLSTAPDTPVSLPSLPPVQRPSKEASRIFKWTRMLRPDQRDPGGNVKSWCLKPSKEHKLRERVYKGIPDSWRGGAWDFLMTRYSRAVAKDSGYLGNVYKEGLEKPSTYDIQIDLDVPRTIGGHIMFRTRYGAGQRSLFHVLHSFSLHCSTCGYVQGMGPIAATLLCYFEPERVYTALVRLHDAYSLHAVFSPGFPGLLEAIYIQERITEQMMPDVYAAFVRHAISTTSYATKWYITLFSNSVPFQTQLRLWDAFLLEGYDVFVAVAVAIVWVYRDLITAGSATFETILSLLSSFFVPQDEDSLVHWIGQMLGDKKLRSSMLGWKADWKALVAAGKDGAALL